MGYGDLASRPGFLGMLRGYRETPTHSLLHGVSQAALLGDPSSKSSQLQDKAGCWRSGRLGHQGVPRARPCREARSVMASESPARSVSLKSIN